MTEEEWLACPWPFQMLAFLATLDVLDSRVKSRKFRQFMVACCRRWFHFLSDDRSRQAVEIAELHATGNAKRKDLMKVYKDAQAVPRNKSTTGDRDHDRDYFLSIAAYVAATRFSPVTAAHEAANFVVVSTENHSYERMAQVSILHDLFHPFRLITLKPNWLSPTVRSLSSAAYDKRSMPSGELDAACLAILADALEDAGCDNVDILTHLRSPGPHVRGCWALDLLLGKE